jgi:osmotically-inducible protein OsmY
MQPKLAKKEDKDLRDRVERQLDWAPEITSTKIGVAANDGVVTLTGFVDTYAEKQTAERVAKRTFGVKAVANDVQVTPLFEKTDADIASAAVTALAGRVDVPKDRIKVTVEDGWLYLDGKVDWKYQSNAAESAVKKLAGVLGVVNHIEIKPQVSAEDVKHKIEDALRRTAELDARRLRVESSDGTVELYGTLHTWTEKQAAEWAAWAAPGVTKVISHISIVP